MTEIVTWDGFAIDTWFGTLDGCINKIGIGLVFVVILCQGLLLKVVMLRLVLQLEIAVLSKGFWVVLGVL